LEIAGAIAYVHPMQSHTSTAYHVNSSPPDAPLIEIRMNNQNSITTINSPDSTPSFPNVPPDSGAKKCKNTINNQDGPARI
jgi:hypothetical protein